MRKDHTNATLSDKNSGFSLIEVMIAMAIFSIGILAVGSMQLSTGKNNSTGNLTTQATMLAREKIEELKTLSRSDLDTADGNDTVADIYGRQWDRKWETDEISSSAYKLIVTVSWSQRGGPRNVVLESISRGKRP